MDRGVIITVEEDGEDRLCLILADHVLVEDAVDLAWLGEVVFLE